MKKTIKWVASILLSLFFLFWLAAVGAVYLVNSSHGRNLLLNQINTLIPGRIMISNLQFSPLKGTLKLAKVSIEDPDSMEIAGFKYFFFKINWRSLLEKEIRISEIRLQHPWGRLYLDHNGRFNLLEAVVPKSDKKETPKEKSADSLPLPFNVVLDYLTIEDGDISFDYPLQALSFHGTGINVWGDGNLFAELAHLKVGLNNVGFKARDMNLPPSRLKLSAGLNRDQLELNEINLDIGNSNLNIAGHLADLFNLYGLDLEITSVVNMSEIAEIFQLEGTWSGNSRLSAGITGEVQNPNIDLKMGFEKGTLFNRAINQIDLAANLSDRRLSLEKLLVTLGKGDVKLAGKVDLQQVFAHGFLKPPVNLDSLTFDMAMDQTTPDLGSWVPEVPGLGGALESHMTLTGKGASLSGFDAELNLKAKGSRLTATGVRRPINGTFALSAKIKKQTFKLQELNGNIDGIQIAGKGTYDHPKKSATAQLALNADDLSQPLTLFGLPDAKGTLHLSLDLAGALNHPQVKLLMDSTNLGYGKLTLGSMDIAADLSPDNILHISSLKLANQGSTVNGKVQLRFLEGWKGLDTAFHQNVELDLGEIELRDFYHQELVKGTLDGKIMLSGWLDNLKGAAKLSGRDLTTESIRLGNLRTKVRLDGRLLQLEELLLQNQKSELRGSGQILLLDDTFAKLSDNPNFQLALKSKQIFLEDFIDKIKGRFSLDSQLGGTLKHPQGLVALNGRNIETGVQTIAAVELFARVDNDKINLIPLKIALSKEDDVVLTGWARKDLSFGFELKSDGINLSSLQAIEELKGFEGVVKTYISGYGTLKDPSIDGSLLLEKIKINAQPFDDFRLHLTLRDHLLKAYGNLEFDVDTSYHLLKKTFAAQLDFYQTQLNPYFRISGQPDMNGTITGKVTVNGNIEHPADLAADLDLEELTLFLKKKRLFQTQKVTAHMVDQRIRLEETHVDLLSKGNLSVAGAARLKGPVDISMSARLPISDAADFSEVLVDSRGQINLNARVTGSLPRPQIEGSVGLKEIALTIPANAQRVEKLNGDISITSDRIHIKSLKGKLDTGSFGVDGNIEHDFFKPKKMSLNFFADTLPVEVPDTLSLLLNSRIELSGEGEKATAKGDIVLLSGSYYKDVKIDLSLLQNIGKRSRSVAPPAEPITLPFFKTIGLKIDVNYREPFLVENNLADMEIRPDLSVGGTLNHPVVSGRANVTEGTLTFKKKTFTVNKGVIDFVNPYNTEMSIDIESSTEIRDWTINLIVKGTLDNLEFRLSSEPALASDADILSLLIFGKTSEEFSNGETKGTKSTNELLAGLIADTFSDELKGATGMDILELETGAEDGANVPSDRVKVTVGKHLSDRMTFKVSMESENGETVSRYMPEYKILDHILVSAFQDTQGTYGGELVFRIEFR